MHPDFNLLMNTWDLTCSQGLTKLVFFRLVPKCKQSTLAFSQKHNPGNGRKAPYKSFSWAFLSTDTSWLPKDSMRNSRQWVFCSLDALPSREINAPFIFRQKCAWKKAIPSPETPRCRKWDQPASFTILLADWPFVPLRDFTNCSTMKVESWEQNVNSSAPDKHAARNPVLLCMLPWLAYLIYFLLALNKRDLYIWQVNKELL